MTVTHSLLSGAGAGLAWTVANLVYDAVFGQVVKRHQDQLNPRLLGRPGLLLLLLTLWLIVVGAVFGVLYSLIYTGLPGSGVTRGLFFGAVLLFLPFARAPLEGRVLTKSPPAMHWFFLGEALVGLSAYGLALGWLAA